MSIVWPYHFVCGVVLLLVFLVSLLDSFGFFILCFEGLGIWLGNRKVSGARGELDEVQHVM